MSCVIIDITDQPFNLLIARYIVEKRRTNSGTRIFWQCDCICGNTAKVESYKIRTGHTKSCGCLWEKYWTEMLDEKSKTERGQFKHLAEFHIWFGMIQRCYDPHTSGYAGYGGRGITVCERWRNSFQAFYEDKGPRPSPEHSLDRFPDQNGPYSHENTRWATQQEQMRNMRGNRLITYQDRTLCLAEWAEELGMTVDRLESRLRKNPSIERAFTMPVKSKYKYITFRDKTLTVSEWARTLGMERITLSVRLRKWSVERALTEPIHHR